MKDSDIERCRSLLRKGVHPDAKARFKTPLAYALLNVNVEICRLLLEHGASLRCRSDNNADGSSSVLPVAVLTGKVELVQLILDHGADINEVYHFDNLHLTALNSAVAESFRDIANYLIQKNAKVNYPEDADDRPIHIAASKGHVEIVQLLINAGADINVYTEEGCGPLHTACRFPETALALLANGADVNHVSKLGTPLMLASRWNCPETVKLFLQYKPKLEIMLQLKDDSYDGMTALVMAAFNGNTEIVRLLLEAGADINGCSQQNHCALHYAVHQSSTEMLRTLLEYSPSLDLVDKNGNTALHLVYGSTPVEIVRRLVNAGASPNIPNNKGNTLITRTLREKNTDVVKYLLGKKVGPKIYVDTAGGRWGSPLHLACYNESLELIKALVDYGAWVDYAVPGFAGTPLHYVCLWKDGSENKTKEQDATTNKTDRNKEDKMTLTSHPESLKTEIIRYLIEEAKAKVNAKGGQFGYPLNAAFSRGTLETVKYLLEKGARNDMEDDLWRKPIHFAAFRTPDFLDLLPTKATDFAIKDKLGRTPLHYAVVSGQAKVVQCVLDCSAELINEPDCDGWTPILWAARRCGKWETTTGKQLEVIELLLTAGTDLWGIRRQSRWRSLVAFKGCKILWSGG